MKKQVDLPKYNFPILQFIIISWNKEYRGGINADLRNKVEIKYKLSDEYINRIHDIKDNIFCYQCIYLDAYDDFKPRYDYIGVISEKDNKIGAISLKMNENKIDAMYYYNSEKCGAPIRDFHQKKLELEVGQYGRIIYNGRFSDRNETGNWIYKKKILNIILSDSIDENIFINNDITKEFSDLAFLY